MTAIACCGEKDSGGAAGSWTALKAAIIARPVRTYLWLGLDSIALIIVYALGILMLTRVVG